MKVTRIIGLFSIAMLAFAPPAMAGFLVDVTGTGSANASGTGPGTSSASSAFGIDGTNSWFSGVAVDPDRDTYTFSYTPGTAADDLDNLAIPSGQALGDARVDAPYTFTPETLTATGAIGGSSGLYNVYITWPESSNTNSAGSTITITSDGAPVVLDPITMNSNENGPGAKGNNAWLQIAAGISLTEGSPYSVTVEANVNSFVSQRVHGVLWELQPVPEPTTGCLLLVASMGMALIRRNRV